MGSVASQEVVVVGSVNMDVVARAPVLPLPGETVMGIDLSFHPGGKGANQAVAASRAGAATALVGRLGSDQFAVALRAFLEEERIDLGGVDTVPGSSGTALITVDRTGENTIVVVAGANARLQPADAQTDLGPGAALVAQLEIPMHTVAAALGHGRARGATTILNAAPAHEEAMTLLEMVDVLVVNTTELAVMAGDPTRALRSAQRVGVHATRLSAAHGCSVVVTLGAAGALASTGEGQVRVSGHPVDAVDATGAGDCFVGNLAARLAAGDDLADALVVANAAAALCATRPGPGPSMPTLTETRSFLRGRPLGG